MDRCNGHSEEAWSAPRNCQGLHKVLEHHLWFCLCLYLSNTCESFLQQFFFRSESWVFSMYNGECYDLIRQLANLGMRKLISEDSYHQVVSRFQTNKLHREFTSRYTRTSTCYWSEAKMCQKSLPSWKGTWTPGKTLKPIGIWTKSICTTMVLCISRKILQSILNNFILPRVRFCLPVGEKLDGRVECFLFTPFNKKYRFVLVLSSWFQIFGQVWNPVPQL